MYDRITRMASWSEFAADEPRLARAIHALLHQYGPGLGYLATVRADGGPRVHPVSPVITDEGLFCFVVDSPKRRDLERDGRYALHSFPPEDSDDEAYVAGRAEPVTDPRRIARHRRQPARRAAGRLAAVRAHRRGGDAVPGAARPPRCASGSTRPGALADHPRAGPAPGRRAAHPPGPWSKRPPDPNAPPAPRLIIGRGAGGFRAAVRYGARNAFQARFMRFTWPAVN